MSGTTHGLELVNEFCQHTHVLAAYVVSLTTETDACLKKVNEKFKSFFNSIKQLDEDMKKGFCEIDKVSKILVNVIQIN